MKTCTYRSLINDNHATPSLRNCCANTPLKPYLCHDIDEELKAAGFQPGPITITVSQGTGEPEDPTTKLDCLNLRLCVLSDKLRQALIAWHLTERNLTTLSERVDTLALKLDVTLSKMSDRSDTTTVSYFEAWLSELMKDLHREKK